MPDEIRLVPIAHGVHDVIMKKDFQVWFWRWRRFPFVIMSRKRLDNWTWNAIDHAVYRTARIFRGQDEIPHQAKNDCAT